MSKPTWFLLPDFTYKPGGQIALGMVIKDPKKPTLTPLASLSDLPSISAPEITTIMEENRAFSIEKTGFFGHELFAKFLEVVGLDTSIELSWFKIKSFSKVDHEVQMYDSAFTVQTLKALLELEPIKQRVGRLRRPVYIVSGLRIAQQKITVTDEKSRNSSGSFGGSAQVPAGAVPVEVGGFISGGGGKKVAVNYETAPGIIFAYRLHVIRPKESPTAEVYTRSTAFMSGNGEDEEEVEVELIEADAEVLRDDLDIKTKAWRHEYGEDCTGSYIVFN